LGLFDFVARLELVASTRSLYEFDQFRTSRPLNSLGLVRE
jgi:hypothetical protein